MSVLAVLREAVSRAREGISDAAVRRAVQGYDLTPLGGELGRRFRSLAPELERTVRRRAKGARADLAREMSQRVSRQVVTDLLDDQVSGVMRTLERARLDGWDGAQTTAMLRRQVGLSSRYVAALHAFQAGLREKRMTALQRERQVDAYAGRLLSSRLRMLDVTTTARAKQAAELATWGSEPGALKVWRTARNERTCRVCAPMDGVAVPVWDDWILPDGRRASLPIDSHPSCQCDQELDEA